MAADKPHVVNVLSLFSGIGGLELGLERAGMTVVGQVEIDPFCRRVLAKHWPEVPRHDDVRTAPNWWAARARPAVHVVAGGFPCQPVSVAGRRKAQADPRWLWPSMAAVISSLRPEWVIGENVPGLRTRGLADVLSDLDGLGYRARAGYISASEMGAPHERERIFILAHADRIRCDRGAGHRPIDAGLTESTDRRSVAHADSIGRLSGRDDAGQPEVAESLDRSALAHADRVARQSSATVVVRPDPETSERDHGVDGRAWPVGDHWAAEPDVGRVAHGVPARVDRLRALGNAVVPQVAEHVGRLVMAAAS